MPRYIEDLNECTDPVSGDYMWLVDASAGSTDKDRKVDVGKFARLAVAQSFTATQTFSNVSIGTSGGSTQITKPADGHTLMMLDTVTLAAGSKFTFPATNGLLVINSHSYGRSSVYALTANSVTAIAQDAVGYSTTMGTANHVNVYHNGTYFEIENGYGAGQIISWIVIGY
jgi:hypothetical protein